MKISFEQTYDITKILTYVIQKLWNRVRIKEIPLDDAMTRLMNLLEKSKLKPNSVMAGFLRMVNK